MSADTPRTSGPLARTVGFLVWVVVFLRALIQANLSLAATVLFKKREELQPGFFTYRVDRLSRFEILVLAQCITLTPGTTTVQVSRDFQTLLVHSLDVSTPDATREEIRRDLEAPILRWTR